MEKDKNRIEDLYIQALDNYMDAPTPYDQEVAMRKVQELSKLLPSDFNLSEYSKEKK